MQVFRWIALATLLTGTLAHARSSGAPSGMAAVNGGSNCTLCHSGTLNSGSGKIQLSVINAVTYQASQTVQIRVTVTDPTAQRWGFELTPRLASDSTQSVGTLSLVSGDTNAQLNASGGIQYATHTSAGTRAGTTGGVSWDILWTAPSSNPVPVTFWAAGNAANGDGSPSGDHIYSTSVTLNPAASASATTTFALPQIDAGGLWYTALYLTNYGNSSATATAKFYDAAGAPLALTLGDGSSSTSQLISLAAGATALVEMPGGATEAQGWAQLELPDKVTGYGLFRFKGNATQAQESTVALAPVTAQGVRIIFDDTKFATAVALANPTDNAGTVTATVRDNNGNVVGPGFQFSLPARGRVAFLLRDKEPLAVGKLGSVDFTIDQGALAPLALRANGSAFASITPITLN